MPSLLFRTKRSTATTASDIHRRIAPRTFSGGRVATFHAIETPVDGDANGIYNMSANNFASHVRALDEARQRYSYLSILKFGASVSEGVSITFDDGYATTLSYAMPLLVKHAMPFHVFVSPALVESGDPRYLDVHQLKELAQSPGVTIGAHGYHHVPLSSLSPRRQLEDLSAAKRWLEDLVQQPVTTLSYPFGDTPVNIRSAVQEAGYSLAACSIWGFNDQETDLLMLRRIDCWNGDSQRTTVTKLLGYWNWIGKGSRS